MSDPLELPFARHAGQTEGAGTDVAVVEMPVPGTGRRFVIAALATVLHRYTGRHDITFDRPGDSPLRIEVPADPTRAALLAGLPPVHDSRFLVAGLDIRLAARDEGLAVVIEYPRAHFERADIERMTRDLATVLAQPADEHLANLSLGDGSELEWTATAYPRESSVPELFEQCVDRTPDAPALWHDGRYLSYRDLDARANQLAHHLSELGVGDEARVGLCLLDTADWVIGALATLKAGGAYVPLDPSYPPDRLRHMCADSAVRVVLTSRDTGVDLPGRRVLVDAVPAMPATRPAGRISPDALAYVMYTSGSTGRPKGVAVTHRNIVRLVRNTDFIDVRTTDTVAQAANISFDAATLETWGALLNGARLVGLDHDDVLVPERLAEALRTHRVDVLFLATSLARQIAMDMPAALRTLRYFTFGGEQADLRAVTRLRQHCPDTEIVNGYGPTEGTTYSTTYRCDGLTGDERIVPIGRAIANSSAYVLDAYLQPMPAGVPGELYTGGDGIARGYLGRPRLTADRFVPDPFSDRPGARLYRTGDLVRRRPDGELEFLGRTDRQVKIRGYRIEPAEIEEVLRGFPGLAEVVVRVDRAEGDPRLVAYVVLDDGVGVGDLRGHLAGQLPEYMVPSVLVPMSRLPLTPNGKVDTAALPPVPTAEAASAATPTEQAVLEIWGEVLGRAVPSVDANLFELGGHSLTVARVRSRLVARLGVDVPLRRLFDHPTVAELSSVIDETTRSSTVDEPDRYPLTAAQRRMWLHDRLRPGSTAHHIVYRIDIGGPLDVEALRGAFDAVVANHQALRTLFVTIDGEPWQEILPEVPESARLKVGEPERGPFDLDKAPPVRATVTATGQDTWVLELAMHHIVCDGWSMGIIFDELSRAYAGRPVGMAPRHVDVANQPVNDESRAYWHQHLAGAPEVLDLPADRPRAAMLDEDAEQLSFHWPAGLASDVANLARETGGTPFTVLLAAWDAVLHRHTHQPDFLVATPVAGRISLPAEATVGLFVNTLALRVKVSPSTTFRELARQARDTALAGLTHQDLPFDAVLDDLRPERDPSRPPLAQVMFAMEDGWEDRLRLPGLTVRCAELHNGAAMFDLTLVMTFRPDGLEGRLEYRKSLFDRETAERMANRLRTLLTHALADPDRRVAELPLMPEEERAAVEAWSLARPSVCDDRPVHDLVAEQRPDRVAVAYQGGTLTYAELDRRADQIAALLLRHGVGAEEPVGLCMRTGPDLVAGFLGVWKAGAMCLPVDPGLPADRVRYLVEDSGARVVFTDTASVLPAGPVALTPADLDPSSGPPGIEVAPDGAAYLIYTSGSTGRPKGVVGTHRGLRNLAQAQQDLLGVRPDDRVLQFHSPGFDVALSDLVTALCAGAELHLVSRQDRTPGPALQRVLRENRITVADLPPVALTVLDPAALPDLRILTVGGEPCPADVVAAWAPGRALHNAYGPTETTVTVTAGRLERDVHIGRPVTGTRVHVLDEELRPVPIGVTGELCVGGACVSRGYLGRPGLTAAAYVPDPAATGERMYRTGDLARWRPDGNLEILGRSDAQVKVRGHRIEPGEVEARLRECACVLRCVVVVREDRPGDRRLVGYVVVDGPEEPERLRAELGRVLPDYMIPSAFVAVPDLPTTPSGKIDHRALPAPGTSRPRLATAYESPRDAAEETVAAVWRAVLGLDRIGVDDNFFDLGGNSMLLVQVHTRLREKTGADLAAVDLFRFPTIATLAGFLSATTSPAEPDTSADTTADRRLALAMRTRRVRGEQE